MVYLLIVARFELSKAVRREKRSEKRVKKMQFAGKNS